MFLYYNLLEWYYFLLNNIVEVWVLAKYWSSSICINFKWSVCIAYISISQNLGSCTNLILIQIESRVTIKRQKQTVGNRGIFCYYKISVSLNQPCHLYEFFIFWYSLRSKFLWLLQFLMIKVGHYKASRRFAVAILGCNFLSFDTGGNLIARHHKEVNFFLLIVNIYSLIGPLPI